MTRIRVVPLRIGDYLKTRGSRWSAAVIPGCRRLCGETLMT